MTNIEVVAAKNHMSKASEFVGILRKKQITMQATTIKVFQSNQETMGPNYCKTVNAKTAR